MDKITIEDIKAIYAELHEKLRFTLRMSKLKEKYLADEEFLIGYDSGIAVSIEELDNLIMNKIVPNTENEIIKEKASEFHNDLVNNGCIKLYIDENENGIEKRKGFVLRPLHDYGPRINKDKIIPQVWTLEFYKKYPYPKEEQNNKKVL